VCNLETYAVRRPRPELGCYTTEKKELLPRILPQYTIQKVLYKSTISYTLIISITEIVAL
jgi:hypothetical protein